MTKKEEDFETLQDYNNYLEEVESITWNLINNEDVEATESRLRRWEEHQKAELNPNASRREFEPSVPTDLKKGATQRKGASAANAAQTLANQRSEDKGFNFHGLKKRVAPPPEAPFDPFGSWSIAPQYYVLQDDYDVDWLTKQKNDPVHMVGGYDMANFYNRALLEAFGGFGVFIEEEIIAKHTPSMIAGVGTIQAASVAAGVKDVHMDDVF